MIYSKIVLRVEHIEPCTTLYYPTPTKIRYPTASNRDRPIQVIRSFVQSCRTATFGPMSMHFALSVCFDNAMSERFGDVRASAMQIGISPILEQSEVIRTIVSYYVTFITSAHGHCSKTLPRSGSLCQAALSFYAGLGTAPPLFFIILPSHFRILPQTSHTHDCAILLLSSSKRNTTKLLN